MSVAYIIAHKDHEMMNTDYFVEQLKRKWAEVRIYPISGTSQLQFEVSGEFWVLGDCTGTGISIIIHSTLSTAQFTLWYRSIVPVEWQLRYYDSGLYFDPIFITHKTSEEQIMAGFKIPFDINNHQD